jgi:hypothetical protein
MMSYVLMHADLAGLDPAEVGEFQEAAAELGLDVIDLSPDLSIDPGTTVLISTALGALLVKVAEIAGGDAAEKLNDLIRRLIRRENKKRAIEDRERRITFVFDEKATVAGPVAVAAMIALRDAINAIPDGTVLTWDSAALEWRAQ